MLSHRAALPSGALAGAFLLLSLGVAGCASKFEEPKPAWSAGHQWEYESRSVASTTLTGDVPPAIRADLEEDEGTEYENATVRLEVFNASARSVEGLPLYVAAELTTRAPEPAVGNATVPTAVPGTWAIRVFRADTLNPVRPLVAVWSGGEVQLTPDDTSNDTVESEDPWFAFPLTPGKTWRAARPIEELNDEEGTLEAKVTKRLEKRKVPAGAFETVRIRSTLAPRSLQELKSQIRSFLEGDGYKVDDLGATYLETRLAWYAGPVRFLVEQHVEVQTTISVSGDDPEGDSFDFTYLTRATVHKRLLEYELGQAAERPLSFADEILRGAYQARPIVPTSAFAVEVLAAAPSVNAAADSAARFYVRVYNSTAGERPLRDPESDRPAQGDPGVPYDHERFQVNWTVEARVPSGWRVLEASTGDEVRLSLEALGGPGLKRVTARFVDRATGDELNDDRVLYEVFWSRRVSVTATEANVTEGGVETRFPVAFGAALVNATVFWSDPSPHPTGSLRVEDGSGERVADDDPDGREFLSRDASAYRPGDWRAQFRETFPPPVPGTTYALDVTVRYASD